MPNHVHGIIRINQRRESSSNGAASLRHYYPRVYANSLGAIVRGYKSAVTYQINALQDSRGTHVWHRNYFEHVVRNQTELEAIVSYIQMNPANWKDDPENVS